MNTVKIGRNDRCSCGSLLKYKNCCGRHRAPAQAPITPQLASIVATKCMEGFGLYQSNNLYEAERICLELLNTVASHPDVLHLLGMVRTAQGRHDEAVNLIDEAIARAPRPVASMYSNKGLSLKALSRPGEAEQSFRNAIRLDPRDARIRKNFGLLLMEEGRHRSALDEFNVAIGIEPLMADVWGEISLCYVALAEWESAGAAANRALEINSRIFNAHSALSTIYLQNFNFSQASVHFEKAREIEPRSSVLLENYAQALLQTNRTKEARATSGEIYRLTGKIEGLIRERLFIPVLYESWDDIEYWRKQRTEALHSLMSIEPMQPGIEINHLYDVSVFYLAFHGLNDVELMRAFARFYEHLIPDLRRDSPYISETLSRSGEIRVGFFCKNVHEHPITHSFSALFEYISQKGGVRAFLISPMGFDLSNQQGTYKNFNGEKIGCPAGYQAARRLIEELRLDIIIYTDIGMDPLSYFLASTRLAPLQCSIPGHPVTTGIKNVDVYISTSLVEPDDASGQYSEFLELIDEYWSMYHDPGDTEMEISPAEAGFPEGMRYYVCPVMLQKVHPDFDAAIAAIIRADEMGVVIMFKTERMPWSDNLTRRLSKILTPVELERVLFLPYIREKRRFMATLRLADVVLDTFHFGLGSTFSYITKAGVPFVTWPGTTNRGRAGVMYSRLLEVPELVVESREDYVTRAVQIASDKSLRSSISERYQKNAWRLYGRSAGFDKFFNALTRHLKIRKERLVCET